MDKCWFDLPGVRGQSPEWPLGSQPYFHVQRLRLGWTSSEICGLLLATVLLPLSKELVEWWASDSGLASWHNPITGHHDGFVEGLTDSRWCIWNASEDVGLEMLAATCYHMEPENEDTKSSMQRWEVSLITSFWLLSPAGFENPVRAIHHARQYISYFCFCYKGNPN